EADTAVALAAQLNADRPGLLFLHGWISESLGRDAEAMDLYRRHLEVHADDLTTRRRLVRLLTQANRWGEAFDNAHKVSAARPRAGRCRPRGGAGSGLTRPARPARAALPARQALERGLARVARRLASLPRRGAARARPGVLPRAVGAARLGGAGGARRAEAG